MNLLLSLLLASCVPRSVLALKSQFSHGVIIEYEDWAAEDNTALLEDVKATLGSSNEVDEINIEPRIELSSSIFRGISAKIIGVGNDVSSILIQSRIQDLKVVKNVSPITALKLLSPIGNFPSSSVEFRDIHDSSNASPQVTSRQSTTGFAPHVMTGVDKLHAAGIKGKGITIAIMDTGFDYKQDSLGNSIGPGQKAIYGYDWVGDDYNFDAGTEAVEDGDPYADCSAHGSHIFGTVGANPTKFGVVGVAPEASFELHRVLGCEGTVGLDVTMKATIAIYERGVDIITASIGGRTSYPDYPWSVIAQRINQNGTYFQFAAGNDGAGYYTGGRPASGIDVPAIGAVYNTETAYYLWNGNYTSGNTTTDLTVVPGTAIDFPPALNLWTASSVESDFINTGCGTYPPDLELPDFNTTAVLVSRPPSSACSGTQAQRNLVALGAKYALFYITQADNPVTGPTLRQAIRNISGIANLPGTVGMELFSAYQKDKGIKVSLGSASAYSDSVTVQNNDIAGGRMVGFSSWGPTQDGRSFPTISAPGGQILSTFPRKLGGIGQASGTSTSAPFTAGMAALMMQQHPDWDSATVRNVLATTANPMPYNDNSTKVYGFLAPVFQQGGGLVDAYRAVHTTTIVNVPSLSFNDTANQPKSLSFKVKNIGTTAQTFKISHIGAASGLGISSSDVYEVSIDTYRELSNSLQAVYATLEITPSEVTISPGQESTITVAVTKLPSLDTKLLPFYGGYIALNSTDGTQSITVPYTGIATSLYETQMDVTGSVLATYNSTTSTATAVSGSSSPIVFNVTYRGFNTSWADGLWPAVLVNIRSPVLFHFHKIDLLKENGDLFMNLALFRNGYWSDNHNWILDGTDQNSTFVPEGEYSFRVSALKIYGNQTKDEDWISHTSEPFLLRYNEDSVGLPSPNSTLRNSRG